MSEEAGEDEHALGVDGTSHVHFSLDVQQLAVSQAVGGGDPARSPERVVAYGGDRQAVDLPYHGSPGVDHDRAVGDHLPHPSLDAVGAIDVVVDGLLHVLAADHRATSALRAFAGPVRRLGDEVDHVDEAGRHLALVLHQTGAVLDEYGPRRRERRAADHACAPHQPTKRA